MSGDIRRAIAAEGRGPTWCEGIGRVTRQPNSAPQVAASRLPNPLSIDPVLGALARRKMHNPQSDRGAPCPCLPRRPADFLLMARGWRLVWAAFCCIVLGAVGQAVYDVVVGDKLAHGGWHHPMRLPDQRVPLPVTYEVKAGRDGSRYEPWIDVRIACSGLLAPG